ncbi:MAG: glycosyltransferase [Vicinamibacterales bacterium]
MVMQSLWIGKPLGELQRLSIQSFLANGHPYHLFAYDDVGSVPEGAVVIDAATVLPREAIFTYQHGFGAGSHSAFSNLFRYVLLHQRGGWWVDLDLICLRPFDFDAPYVIATEVDNDGTTTCATCAFTCPPGAPVLQHCIDVVNAADKDRLEWGQIGPQLFTTAVARFGLDAHRVPSSTFNPIDWVDYAQIAAAGGDLARLAGSHALHTWNQMWKQAGIDITASPPDSLYGQLRARYGSGAPTAGRR